MAIVLQTEALIDELLGELTYDIPLAGHRAEPVWGSSLADVQQRVNNARARRARQIRWSRNEDADVSIHAEELDLDDADDAEVTEEV